MTGFTQSSSLTLVPPRLADVAAGVVRRRETEASRTDQASCKREFEPLGSPVDLEPPGNPFSVAARDGTGRGQGFALIHRSTEYSLLRLFVQHAGKVLTHRQILREVWGPNYVEQTHYLRVYLAHLREKLEANPAQPELLITESGVGYRLVSKE